MKTTKTTDEFAQNTCLKGLGLFLVYSHTHVYNFCYSLTFKRSLKTMAKDFKDPEENPVPDVEFFEDVNDAIVRHGCQMIYLILDYLDPFLLRHGLNDYELIEDEEAVEQALRYAPNMSISMNRNSYRKVAFAYQRFVEELSNTFYHYACALSLQRYQIPLPMRTRLSYTPEGSFRFLHVEDHEVASLIELINALQEKEVELKKMMG
jgi:hypothetical protein